MRRNLAIVVVAAVLLGGACTTKSLDVEAGSPSTAPPTSSENHGPTSTTAAVPPSSETTMETPGSAEGGGTGSADEAGAAGSRAGQCPTEAMVDELQGQLDGTEGGPVAAEAMAGALDLLALYVPPDLASDFRIMREGVEALFEALASASLDPTTMTSEQIDEMAAAFDALDTPELEAASQRIEDYFEQACPDVDLNGDDFEPVGRAVD